jgi:hypothetical protein
MENGALLQAGRSLTPFAVALSEPCAVPEEPSRSRMPIEHQTTMLKSSITVNSLSPRAASWRGDFLARFLKAVEGWR